MKLSFIGKTMKNYSSIDIRNEHVLLVELKGKVAYYLPCSCFTFKAFIIFRKLSLIYNFPISTLSVDGELDDWKIDIFFCIQAQSFLFISRILHCWNLSSCNYVLSHCLRTLPTSIANKTMLIQIFVGFLFLLEITFSLKCY